MPAVARARAAAPAPAPTAPLRVHDVELSAPLPEWQPGWTRYVGLHALVRMHGHPLGVVQVPRPRDGESLAALLRDEVRAQLAPQLARHLDQDGLALDELPAWAGGAAGTECGVAEPPATRAPVTVVVPTCGRPEELARCLRSLGGLDYPAYDVVVVDNAVDATTSQVVHEAAAAGLRVRYVPEPRRGASRARNTGVEAARGEIIAFTDDDVAVDPDWLRRLVAGFGRGAGVSCVTGLTMPLELETPAQVWFESYGGFAQGFEPRLYDLRDNRGSTLLYPYTAGAFGASNNLAVLRSTFLAHGGFDERLGPGTPTHSAEDQDLLLAVILSGARIAYEPRAIVRHAHRRDEQALRQQVFRYSVGMTALLTKWVVSDPRVRRDLAHRAPRVLPLALARGRGVGSAAPSYPGWLRRRERAGFLVGPAAYWRSWAVSAHAESVSR